MKYVTTITDLQDIKRVDSRSDIIEIRLDQFEGIHSKEDIQKLFYEVRKETKKPLILTLRGEKEGGGYRGSKEKKEELLKEILKQKPEYIDLEKEDFLKLQKKKLIPKERKIILSYHNFEGTPDNLGEIYKQYKEHGTFLVKIITYAKSSLDTLRMLSLTKSLKAGQQVTTCMGEKGSLTRTASKLIGNSFCYTSIDNISKSAPGKYPLSILKEQFNSDNHKKGTSLFALIGGDISKSKGVIFHNRSFREKKIDALYENLSLEEEELPAFFEEIKKHNFRGISVTMPLKEKVTPFLDNLEEDAQAIGAVNTITIERGKLIGSNCDGIGALNALEEVERVKGKKILLIGAGGTAKAILYEAKKRGAEVIVVNRTLEKAESLAQKFSCKVAKLSHLPSLMQEGYVILINATKIGMWPNSEASLVPPEAIIPKTIAMDIISYPEETLFLKDAKKRGCKIIKGTAMYINQALQQQKRWGF